MMINETEEARYDCFDDKNKGKCTEHTRNETGWRDLYGYGSHGFLVDFNSTNTEAKIAHLRAHNWLDNFTRALVLRMTVYSV